MESLKALFLQHAAWVWPIVAFCVAVIAVIAVLAIPAYFVFYPLIRRVHESVSAYLSGLKQRHLAARESRAESFVVLLDEFRGDAGITVLRQIDARAEAAYRHLIDVANNVNSSLRRFLDAPTTFQRSAAPLLDVSAQPAPTFPSIPTADQLSVQHAMLRTAKVRLLVSSVILLALIGVNTGMLGQILRDLGFIPHDLVYLGVPLYLVFAFILTLAEAGLGYIHTATRPTPNEPERVAVWPVIAIGLAAVIACVEGFFYSQVAPNKEGFIGLPGGYQVHQTSLFFLWGAALVMVLFGLGMIWSTSLECISQSAAHFPGLVRRLIRHREKFAMASERADRAATHFRQTIDGTRQALDSGTERARALVQEVDNIRTMPPDSPEAIQPHQLTRVDAHHFMHLSGLWLITAALSILIASMITRFAVRATFSYLSDTASLFGGLAIVAAFVVLGALLPRGEVLLEGTGARRKVVSGSPWRDRAAMGMGILISLLFALILWRARTSRYSIVLWLVSYVVGASSAAAVSQAVSTSKGLRLWFKTCGDVVRALAGC